MDILIVESELVIAEAMASVLQTRGHAVVIVNSAEQALVHPLPEVLVAEWQLCGPDGLDLLSEYRLQGGQPHTVFIASDPTLEGCREAFHKGAAEFLAKPFRLKELVQAVEQAGAVREAHFHASYTANRESQQIAPRDLLAFALRQRVGPTCRARMATAVAELIQNSVEHAYPCRMGEIWIDATVDEREMVVRVHDDGIGFDSAKVAGEHLASTRHNGLARAAALAERIELESCVGQGATIILRFGACLVDYDTDDNIDLSELDFFTPDTSEQLLRTLEVDGVESIFQVSPAQAVVIGRLLCGPDPSRIAAQALRS
jgi:FixJ family two-component response regulator